MGAHLYEPLVFSHLVPRRQECWPLEHSSTSRDSNYINQGGNQDCTHGPGCSKLGQDNSGLLRNLNSDMKALIATSV